MTCAATVPLAARHITAADRQAAAAAAAGGEAAGGEAAGGEAAGGEAAACCVRQLCACDATMVVTRVRWMCRFGLWWRREWRLGRERAAAMVLYPGACAQ